MTDQERVALIRAHADQILTLMGEVPGAGLVSIYDRERDGVCLQVETAEQAAALTGGPADGEVAGLRVYARKAGGERIGA